MTDPYYVLDADHTARAVGFAEWGEWQSRPFEETRRVARDTVGDANVSTVFLGIDHSFGGPPLLFETMIFGGEHDYWQDRYTTWDEAMAGHRRVVDALRSGAPL